MKMVVVAVLAGSHSGRTEARRGAHPGRAHLGAGVLPSAQLIRRQKSPALHVGFVFRLMELIVQGLEFRFVVLLHLFVERKLFRRQKLFEFITAFMIKLTALAEGLLSKLPDRTPDSFQGRGLFRREPVKWGNYRSGPHAPVDSGADDRAGGADHNERED